VCLECYNKNVIAYSKRCNFKVKKIETFRL
jgi:hypothetical protein